MTDAAGSPRAEDVRERAEKLLARVGEYPPEPWCNDAITLVRDLLALPAAGSPISDCHASVPKGYKCSDCTIDGEPCPNCYDAAWRRRYPNVVFSGGRHYQPAETAGSPIGRVHVYVGAHNVADGAVPEPTDRAPELEPESTPRDTILAVLTDWQRQFGPRCARVTVFLDDGRRIAFNAEDVAEALHLVPDLVTKSFDRALQDENPAWLPTAANINALPEPIRRYVHDLETRCDPSGDIRELTIARDTCQQQDRALAALRDERDHANELVQHLTIPALALADAEAALAALQDEITPEVFRDLEYAAHLVEDRIPHEAERFRPLLADRVVRLKHLAKALVLLPGSGTGET